MTKQEKLEYLNLLISGTITQQQVADEYGCTHQNIQRILSGKDGSITDEVYSRVLSSIKKVIHKQKEELNKKSIGL